MPLLLTFNGLASDKHTWYLDLDTGAMVQAPSGSSAPYRKVDNAPYYVAMGYATVSGEEDGSDGLLDGVTDGLRAVLAELSPLDGDQSSWTLDDMIIRLQYIQSQDEEALANWQEEQRPHVLSTSPADDATGVAVNAVVSITFDKAMDPLTMIPENFNVSAIEDVGIPNLVDSVVMSVGNTVATLGLSGPMRHGIQYIIEIFTGARTAGDVPFQTPYGQVHGFLTAAGIDGAPSVVSTTPDDEDIDVALDVTPTITFSKPMNPATITPENVLIQDHLDVSVPASITMDETNTVATITPDDPLAAGEIYRITVAGEADGGTTADADGNLLPSIFIQATGFTTVSA